LLEIISKNKSQSIQQVGQNVINTTTTPVIVYTCPAGKRAHVKGWIAGIQRGASTVMFVNAGNPVQSIARWDLGGLAQNDDAPLATGGLSMRFNTGYNIDIILEAGQLVSLTQNAGNNAQFKRAVNIEELPI